MFDLRRATLFGLAYRPSKHKFTRYSKNLRGHGPLVSPSYAYAGDTRSNYVIIYPTIKCESPIEKCKKYRHLK